MTHDPYMKRFEDEVLPQIKDSAVSLCLASGDPDAKQCLEMGAALLLDKPILVVVRRGIRVPANLKRVASAIVEIDSDHLTDDKAAQQKISDALRRILAEDARTHQGKDVP